MKPQYTIIINSTDSFADCWPAFFQLFVTFWPRPWPRIILNTESLEFKMDDVELLYSHTNKVFDKKITWSESILYCLDLANENVILYLQEDYFLNARVNTESIDELVNQMRASDIGCISLTSRGARGSHMESKHPALLEIPPGRPYRVNCQATLWKADFLKQLLRRDENAWQFEIFGSRRSVRIKTGFLTPSPKFFKYDSKEIVSYVVNTGVIKGRWNINTQMLFEKHNIHMDYSLRGFYQNVSYFENKVNTFKKLYKSPVHFIRGMLGLT